MRPAWKPGQQGNPQHKNVGRQRNRVTELHKKLKVLRKQDGLSQEEIDTIEQTLITMTLPELQIIAKTDGASVYEKTLAMALIIDMKNGRTTTLDKIRERQFGKVVQKVDITTGGESLNSSRTISPEEAKVLISKLEAKY